jgi:hypothetical protein
MCRSKLVLLIAFSHLGFHSGFDRCHRLVDGLSDHLLDELVFIDGQLYRHEFGRTEREIVPGTPVRCFTKSTNMAFEDAFAHVVGEIGGDWDKWKSELGARNRESKNSAKYKSRPELLAHWQSEMTAQELASCFLTRLKPPRIQACVTAPCSGCWPTRSPRSGPSGTSGSKIITPSGKRFLLRFKEKGGKEKELPVRHKLEELLDQYLEATGLENEPEPPLFPAAIRKTGKLSRRPLTRTDATDMLKRRLKQAGLPAHNSLHWFRATGITNVLENDCSRRWGEEFKRPLSFPYERQSRGGGHPPLHG